MILSSGKNSFSLQLLLPSSHKLLLCGVWIIVQGCLIWHNGIFTTLEADKYISQAEIFLKTGTLSGNNYWLYSTQIFLIAAAMKFHLGYVTIVVIQLLLNLLATNMFYKLATFFLNHSWLAFLATIIFIINIPYQVYNSFLFTESIFYSLTVIFSSYLLRLNTISSKDIIFILLFIALLSVTRPTGILFFPATACYLFMRLLHQLTLWKSLSIFFGSVIIFIFILNTLLHAGGSLDFMLPFKKENIICGVPTVTNAEIKTLEKGNSVEGLLYYIYHNQEQFFRLCKLKTISFFGLVRNYYSNFHNIYLALFFYPFYVLAVIGSWKMFSRMKAIFVYLLSVIIFYWLTTLLTCDDWHNRFILTVFPFIFLLAFRAFLKKSPGKPFVDQ